MRDDIKTWLGVGPLVIKSMDTTITATFNFWSSRILRIIPDFANEGIINGNGEDISSIKGYFIEFAVTLTDPPTDFGGEGQDNVLELFRILSRLPSENANNQWFYLYPAYSAETSAGMSVKLKSTIEGDDIRNPGEGQVFTMTLRTKNRYENIPSWCSSGNASSLPLINAFRIM